MKKQWYAVAVALGIPCTIICAMNHELGWTVVGVVSVGLNIFNYLNAEEKTGE